MDFDLSDDQRALRAAARDLLAQTASSDRVRTQLGQGVDRELWSTMCEQGWPALALPEKSGGLGLGWVEVVVLATEIGRRVAPTPYLSTALALHALLADTEGLRERLITGDAIAATGWDDQPIADAPAADVVVVVRNDEVSVYEVEGKSPDEQQAIDTTRVFGRIDFSQPHRIVGEQELATELTDRGAVAYAAELLGLAEQMLEVSVEYAKVREQFGRPIGSFQAVKHRCSDMLVDVEGMRSAVYYAAWAIDARTDDMSLAASTAKSWASDAARRVMNNALQVHGGIGFTWEHDLHLYLKRAEVDATQFGDPRWHRDRISRLLRDRLAATGSVF